MTTPSRARRRETGQVLVLFALGLVVLLLAVSLVIDGSFAWVRTREAQNAADMAALAGARIVLLSGSDASLNDGSVASAIVSIAVDNNAAQVTDWGTPAGPMYTDGDGHVIAGAYVGSGCTSQACAVLSTAHIPSGARGVTVPTSLSWAPILLGFIGTTEWTASTHAVARYQTQESDAPCAICILKGGFLGSNSVNVTANNGSVLINGSTASANSSRITANDGSIEVNGDLGGGNSIMVTATNGSILVSGNLSGKNSSRFSATSGSIAVGGNLTLQNSSRATAQSIIVGGSWSFKNSSTATPTPIAGGPVSVPVVDPLAFLTQPRNPNPSASPHSDSCTNSCTKTITPASGTIESVTVANSSRVSLSPGLYGSITLSNSSTANLQPGTYYIAGSGGKVQADNSSRIVGLGPVTLVFLDQTSLNVSNSAGLQIAAPVTASSGYPYPGMAIYAARGNSATFSLANSASFPVTGTIYAPDATLTTANSANVGLNSLIVVGNYQSANSASLTATYDADQNVSFVNQNGTFGGTVQLVE
jgi:Flp pilus assembly protein TadG